MDKKGYAQIIGIIVLVILIIGIVFLVQGLFVQSNIEFCDTVEVIEYEDDNTRIKFSNSSYMLFDEHLNLEVNKTYYIEYDYYKNSNQYHLKYYREESICPMY